MMFDRQALPRTYWQTSVRALSVALAILSLNGCALESGKVVEDTSTVVAGQVAETAGSATTGEVPAGLLEAILNDLIAVEGLQRDDIVIERAESVIWPDGGLGCPEPGVMYTHAQVPGYWVVMRSGAKRYDYRVSEKGYFRRCKGSSKSRLPVG